MNCALYDEYILAVYNDKIWPNHMKPGVLAWAIAEQGENRFSVNGMGELARNANNFHSLHQRKEMKLKYPCVYHLLSTNEVDNNYIDFPGPQDELEGLMMFIHRPYYGDVDAHMGSFEELLRFLCEGTPSFCPTKGYVERVLSFLPEAEMELRKIGWKPDGDNYMPNNTHPIEHPETYSVNNGLLMLGNACIVQYESPNQDKWVKNVPVSIILHYTASEGAVNVAKYFQDPKSKRSAHIIVSKYGTVYQCVPFHKPAWHSGDLKWNRQSIGIEIENLGCSRVKIGDNVVFVKWNGVKHIPVSDCVYAAHYKEPNIKRWWPKYTPQQYDTLFKLIVALRKAYGGLTIMGHDMVCSDKLDPGMALDWPRLG